MSNSICVAQYLHKYIFRDSQLQGHVFLQTAKCLAGEMDASRQ